MFCPACGYSLQKLSVTTNSGGKFEVDHCGRCGGTWFDPYEINRIDTHEVHRIAHITVLQTNPPQTNEIKKCPNCHKVLTPSPTELVPKGIDLLRCPKCHGIWASQRALTLFKENQDATIKDYKIKGRVFPSLSVVFVPAIFTMLLFLTTFVTIRHLQEQKDNRTQAEAFVTNIQTTVLSKDTARITFKTNVPLTTRISYGPSTLEYTQILVSAKPAVFHTVILRNLKLNSIYIFQITVTSLQGKQFTTDPVSFTTKK